jgi:hypothetical protein
VTLLFQSLLGPDGPLEPSELLRPTLLEVSTDGLRLDVYMGYTP